MQTKDVQKLKEVASQEGVEEESIIDRALSELEERLGNRPWWLKALHFLLGNSAWLEDTFRELVRRYKEAESQ